MARKLDPAYIADVLTDCDIKQAVPYKRLEYMREFAAGASTKEIGAKHNKSPAHIYVEISRGMDDRRAYAKIMETPDYTLKCHLINLNNAMHHFHRLDAHRSCADIRRAIRNLIEILNPSH